MERLKGVIKSISGTLILAGLAGWVIELITGGWESSLLYVDVVLLALGTYILAPTIISRIEGRVLDNKIFLLTTTFIWTVSILSPFILIVIKQGRLVMLGILLSMMILLVFVNRIEVKETGIRQKIERWSYFCILFFPFVYALIIWFDLTLTGLFLVLVALNIFLYIQTLINYVVSFYKSKENWKPIRFQLPTEEPKILMEGITSVQHLGHLDLGFVDTNTCQVELTITYEVNGLHYNKEGLIYNWYAPFEDRLRAFDWESDMKGKWINFIYNPEEPTVVATALGEKEEVEQMIFNYKQQQQKHQFTALGIAVLGFFLFFFKIAVT